MTAEVVDDRLGPFEPPRARRPGLDFDLPCPPDWMTDSVPGSALLNAYSIIFPPLETAMVRHISTVLRSHPARDGVDDAAVRGFLQQEGSHAREHRRSLDCIRAQGYEIDALARRVELVAFGAIEFVIQRVLRPVFGDAFTVGLFAGAEHWTSSLSEWALTAGPQRASVGRLEEPVTPTDLTEMEILFLWHVAEEIEHKSVVADLFAELGGGGPARIASFLLATPAFLALSAWTFGSLVRQAPRVLGPQEWARTGGWRGYAGRTRRVLAGLGRMHVRTARQYLRPGFRPADHDTDALVRAAFDRLQELRDVRLVNAQTGSTLR